jgi:ribosomal protein L37AE/L43A
MTAMNDRHILPTLRCRDCGRALSRIPDITDLWSCRGCGETWYVIPAEPEYHRLPASHFPEAEHA